MLLYHVKKMAGFTLIELMVSIGILTLLLSLTLPNFKNFQARRDLRVQTDFVVNTIREVQNTVAVGGSYDDTSGMRHYGIHFSSTPGENTMFIVFADSDSSGESDGRYTEGVDTIVKYGQKLLRDGVEIQTFSESGRNLDLVFSPPESTLRVNGANMNTIVNLTLAHDRIEETTVVSLNTLTGQVSSN